MRLRDLDEQLLRLYLLRDNPKYTDMQRSAIIDCINAIKDTPEEVGYHNVPKEAEFLTKQINRGGFHK